MVNNVFLKDCRAIAAIEFAIILPFIVALLFAMTEFGLYYTKEQVISRAVNNTSNAIQSNPLNPELRNDAQKAGFGLVNFETPNYFCAKSYATREQADAYCNPGDWEIGTPSGLAAGAPYYVALTAFYDYVPLTQLTDYMPDITLRNVVLVSAAETQTHGMLKIGNVVPPYSSGNTGLRTSTLTGSWTVPDGVTSAKVTLVGGGSSGSGLNTVAGDRLRGGKSGGVAIYYLTDLEPGSSLSYIVGAAGLGEKGKNGNPGSETTFDGLSSNGSGFSGYKAVFGPNFGGYRAAYLAANSDTKWYQGGNGGDTPMGFGMGGQSSTHDEQVLSHDAQGFGAGGAGETLYGASRRPGHGAPGLLIIEW